MICASSMFQRIYLLIVVEPLVNLCHLLIAHGTLGYPAITVDRVVGHNDIAPGRKTDPGAAFDWTYFKNALV